MPRHHLAFGYTTGRARRLTLGVLLSTVGIAVCVVAGMALGTVVVFFVDRSPGPLLLVIPILLGMLSGGPLAVWAMLSLVKFVRAAAWLDGTLLTVRGFRARTADLSQAVAIEIDTIRTRTREIPELVVEDEAGILELRLATAESLPLPPRDIDALVAALSASDAPGADEAVAFLESYAGLSFAAQ